MARKKVTIKVTLSLDKNHQCVQNMENLENLIKKSNILSAKVRDYLAEATECNDFQNVNSPILYYRGVCQDSCDEELPIKTT